MEKSRRDDDHHHHVGLRVSWAKVCEDLVPAFHKRVYVQASRVLFQNVSLVAASRKLLIEREVLCRSRLRDEVPPCVVR